jgi:hypothetical protein
MILYYYLMGPPSYVLSVVDGNVMRRITIFMIRHYITYPEEIICSFISVRHSRVPESHGGRIDWLITIGFETSRSRCTKALNNGLLRRRKKNAVFSGVMPCSPLEVNWNLKETWYFRDDGSKFVWNIATFPPDDTALHPGRRQSYRSTLIKARIALAYSAGPGPLIIRVCGHIIGFLGGGLGDKLGLFLHRATQKKKSGQPCPCQKVRWYDV